MLAEVRDALEQIAKESGQKYTHGAVLRDRGETSTERVDELMGRLDALQEAANDYEPPEMD